MEGDNAAVGVERVCEHVWLIDTEALGYKGTVAAYLIVGSRSVLLVDSGYPQAADILVGVLSDFGDMDLILFPTHVHLDHCGSMGALAREFPRAKIIAHRRAAKHLVDPSRLVESVRRIYGSGFLEEVGLPEPVPEGMVSSFEEEIEMDLGGVQVKGIYTPGHAPHHASLFVEPDKAIISGDAISNRIPAAGRIPIPATPPHHPSI